MQLLQEQWL